jgi:deferrochelatase/peroxidase EfeB/predicted acylesterase/phospholipase RssA
VSLPNRLKRAEIQKLVLTGYGADCCRHFVLQVTDATSARRFLAELLRRNWICHAGAAEDDHPLAGSGAPSAVNVGFTWRGLVELNLDQPLLDVLAARAPAFAQGAPPRAASHLADTGDSAAELWDEAFALQRAHVLLTIHAADAAALDAFGARLRAVDGASGLDGWDQHRLDAQHLPRSDGERFRSVHFGFADGIARPTVLPDDGQPMQLHQPGELLLGHANDEGYDRWAAEDGSAEFFRNGSFGVLRQIEQHEDRFRAFLDDTAAELAGRGVSVTTDYLKAKLCGRWPNGALVKPGEDEQPKELPKDADIDRFDFSDDPKAIGCPFGSHIRRTNPRADPVVPERARPLFRRGMPYGRPFDDAPSEQRGLVGLFFCASIEDQFEHLLSNWVDGAPMGPDNRGKAKDPLIGAHEDPAAGFHIAEEDGPGLMLAGLAPFVTTRGTLYAYFPSLPALARIARRGVEPPREVRREVEPPEQPQRTMIAADTAPRDRYCDLVMEGGVTSGIVYSSLVAELAKHYRFQSIAGTSIGSFAAAVTAAAELQRRRGSIKGFQFIHGLPDLLAETGERSDATLLQRLFRPEEKTRRLFAIFLATLNRKPGLDRLVAGIRAAFRQYGRRIGWVAGATLLATLFGQILLAAIAWPEAAPAVVEWVSSDSLLTTLPLAALVALAVALAVLGAVLVTLVAALATAAASIAIDLLRGLVPNGFGLCRGGPAEGEENIKEPTLTFAIHMLVQKAAGRESGEAPVTFEDLWNAPGFPPPWLPSGSGSAGRSIDLQMYATNLTHSRPYRFPPEERDGMERLFFDPKELAPYLPKALLGYVVGFSEAYAPKSASDPDPKNVPPGLRQLPSGKLPIAVAARLGLSFPLLLSAVPLWAIDYEPKRDQRTIRRCWFSDGGLCVNFPIHLFDAFIPPWPTFGISLQTRGEFRKDQRVWLPRRHFEGRGDSWDRRIDNEKTSAATRLASFLFALWNATWRWNDATTARMPGVRDRVVRVLLEENEGGVNIAMSAQQIRALADNYGYPAALALLEKFVTGRGWDEHRWVRFNTLLVALRERIEALAVTAELDRHAMPLSAQITAATRQPPLDEPGAKPLRPEQERELRLLLRALKRLEASFGAAGNHEPYVPEPKPVLRVRPRI